MTKSQVPFAMSIAHSQPREVLVRSAVRILDHCLAVENQPCPPEACERMLSFIGIVLAAPILLTGCATEQWGNIDYVEPRFVPHHGIFVHSVRAPTPTAIFPYGSHVACPQVSIGNGFARCQ
jgi:hypothetical protein